MEAPLLPGLPAGRDRQDESESESGRPLPLCFRDNGFLKCSSKLHLWIVSRAYTRERVGERILVCILCAVTVVGFLAMSIGFIMQEFMCIISYRLRNPVGFLPLIWYSLPLILSFLSFIMHYFTIIVTDVFASPPCARSRALFAAVCLYKSKGTDKSDEQDIDRCFENPSPNFQSWMKTTVSGTESIWFTIAPTIFAFLGAILRALAYKRLGPAHLWGGAIVGATAWMLATTLLYAFADLIVHCMASPATHFRQRLESCIVINRIVAGQLALSDEDQIKRMCERAYGHYKDNEFKKEVFGKPRSHLLENCWRRFSTGLQWQKFWITLICITLGEGLWLPVVIYSTRIGVSEEMWPLYSLACGPLLVFAVFFVAGGFKSCFPSINGLKKSGLQANLGWRCCPATSFHWFTLLFVSLAFLLLVSLAAVYSPSVDVTPLYNQSAMFANPDLADLYKQSVVMAHPVLFNRSTQLRNPWVSNKTTRYPVCSTQWSGLGILDLAALSKYAYIEEPGDFDTLLNWSFSGARGVSKCSRVLFDNYSQTIASGMPRVVAAHFQGFDDGRKGTIVVAVKGTDSIQDAYSDFSLYAAIATLQVAAFVVPVLDVLPNQLIADYLWLYRTPLSKKLEEDRLRNVTDKVLDLIHKYRGADVIITGHSLGGGIAQAVGAHLGIPAVGFSAPGAHFGRSRLQMSTQRQYLTLVNIVPDSDLVPRVDRTDSIAQHIQCREKDGSYVQLFSKYWWRIPAAECHKIQHTICELWRVCGDFRERDFGPSCNDYVDDSNLGRVYNQSDDSVPG